MTVQTPIGEITADERTLNVLSIYAFESARLNNNECFRSLAEESESVGEAIHKALSESGYYDNMF